MEYASKAVGTAGLTTGIIGTALGALSGGSSLLMGNMRNAEPVCEGNQHVTRHELDMENTITSKNMEIAILKSEQYTDKKLVDVYETIMARVNADKDAQTKINTEQAVYNGVNTATMSCMRGQIDRLYSLTALRIPNSSVCPGWGNVTVSPEEAPTT